MRPILKKRKFKRTSDRKLSVRDLSVLDFLWTWKVASTPMLGEMAYKGKSAWWVYKALKQLQNERYIQLLPRGKNLELELWALTELGFEVVLMDRDDLMFHRYRPHAPAHDYLATCLQLGDLWLSPVPKRFFTEQMLSSLAPVNFPKAIRNAEGHIPDGITLLEGNLKQAYIAYEVDLNLKDIERYKATFDYYRANQDVMLIFWLVRNEWIARRILEIYKEEFHYGSLDKLSPKICFINLDDFKTKTWNAEVILGNYKGHSVRKLHANIIQSLGKLPTNFGQKEMTQIFFPKFKSPQKSIASLESKNP